MKKKKKKRVNRKVKNLTDFSAGMYGYEDKILFQQAFDTMRSKMHKQTWLDSIYKVKEK